MTYCHFYGEKNIATHRRYGYVISLINLNKWLQNGGIVTMLLILNYMCFWSKYAGHPISRDNFLIMQEFVPLKHRKYNH